MPYVTTLDKGPPRCRRCRAYINCHAAFVDGGRHWTCNFCGYRNPLPPYYAERITEQNLPAEKIFTTIEYVLPNSACPPPVFLFVLDTALNSEEEEPEFEKAKE